MGGERVASGYIIGISNLAGLSVRAAWRQTANPAQGSSKVQITLQASNSTGGYIANSGAWTLQVGGASQAVKSSAALRNGAGWTDVWARTVTVSHDADGRAAARIRISGGLVSGWTRTSIDGVATLDDLERAAGFVSATGRAVLGVDRVAISISKPAPQMGAVCVIRLGSRTAEIGLDDRTDAEWASDAAWAAEIPGTEMTGTLTLTTYTDASHTQVVGSPVVRPWTAVVSGDVAAQVAAGWATVAPYDGAGDVPQAWDCAIAGHSGADVRFDTSKISPAPGTSIAALRVVYGGATYEAGSGGTARTGIISMPGTARLSAQVVDSRGRVTEEAIALDVLEYYAPRITDATAYRERGSLWASCGVDFAPVGGRNSAALYARYKAATASAWPDVWTPVQPGTPAQMGGGALPATVSYDVQIRAVDGMAASVWAYTVPSDAVALNLMAGNAGAALGKYAERAGWLDSLWGIRTDGDFIAAGLIYGALAGLDVRTGTATAAPDGSTAAQVTHAEQMRGAPVVLLSAVGHDGPVWVTQADSAGFTALCGPGSAQTQPQSVTIMYICIYWGGAQ